MYGHTIYNVGMMNTVGRMVLDMQLPGKRNQGRPKKRYLDVVKEDMQEEGARR